MVEERRKSIPFGLTKEAQEERKRFERTYSGLLEEAKKVSLTVLVWGQNPKRKTPLSDKRKEICDVLRKLGHNAMFSEEICTPFDDLSEKSKEFAQALAAHLIIVLIEDAAGASAEFHDFCDHPEVAPKLYVMVPKKYKSGYSGQGAIRDLEMAYGGVYWYRDSEVATCGILQSAIARVEALRHIMYRYRRGMPK